MFTHSDKPPHVKYKSHTHTGRRHIQNHAEAETVRPRSGGAGRVSRDLAIT